MSASPHFCVLMRRADRIEADCTPAIHCYMIDCFIVDLSVIWMFQKVGHRKKERSFVIVSASHVIPRDARMTLDARTPHNAKPWPTWGAQRTLLLLWKHLNLQPLCPWIEPHTHKLICCWHTCRSTHRPPNNVMMCTKIARVVHVCLSVSLWFPVTGVALQWADLQHQSYSVFFFLGSLLLEKPHFYSCRQDGKEEKIMVKEDSCFQS